MTSSDARQGGALATTRPLVLRQPPGGWGEPSMSPFCMKLECWLRMAKIPFEVRGADMQKAPKGKIPYVELPDGTRMGDSQLIIEHLTKLHGVTLDATLGPAQLATARAVRRMLEEGLYFTGIYARWVDDEGWPHTRAAMASFIPRFAVPFLPLIRRSVRKSIHAQGTGRHAREDIIAMAKADWDAVSILLGDGPYFFGEKATSIDATLYAFEEAVLVHPSASPVKAHVRSLPNLVAHRDRMRALFPPERFATKG